MDRFSSRQAAILALLQEYGAMKIEEIASKLDVTPVTVRRELKTLEENNNVTRYKGVIEFSSQETQNQSFKLKTKTRVAEKNAIARAALKLIRPYSTIIMDSGTTTFALAKAIMKSELKSLAIVTNSIPVVEEMDHGHTIIVTGGTWDPTTASLVGPAAEEAFNTLVADVVFISATGMSAQYGLCVQSQILAPIKTKMLTSAAKKVALLDSSKLGARSGNIFCRIEDIDVLVTTKTAANAEMIDEMRARGVEVICATM